MLPAPRELQVLVALRGLSVPLVRLGRKALRDLLARVDLKGLLVLRGPAVHLGRPGRKAPLARLEGLSADRSFRAVELSSCQVESLG